MRKCFPSQQWKLEFGLTILIKKIIFSPIFLMTFNQNFYGNYSNIFNSNFNSLKLFEFNSITMAAGCILIIIQSCSMRFGVTRTLLLLLVL